MDRIAELERQLQEQRGIVERTRAALTELDEQYRAGRLEEDPTRRLLMAMQKDRDHWKAEANTQFDLAVSAIAEAEHLRPVTPRSKYLVKAKPTPHIAVITCGKCGASTRIALGLASAIVCSGCGVEIRMVD